VIKKEWPGRKKIVYSNKIIYADKNRVNMKVKWAPIGGVWKARHNPPMISPVDLGLNPKRDFLSNCYFGKRCGRLFDAFGFSFCPVAGQMGRIFNIDPYHSEPVLLGNPEMCRHCAWSQNRRKRFELWVAARDGKLEYPTKTYREAIARSNGEGLRTFKKFEERVV
jgi:hypothetical protein